MSDTPAPVADDAELLPAGDDVIEGEVLDAATDDLDTEGEEAPEEDDEDTEELEHEGKKYALPKSLKPLLLMQADYTKKTQDLADQRRASDELQQELSATLATANEAEEAIVEAKASVKAIDTQASTLRAEIAAVESELVNVDFAALQRMEGGELLFRQREQYLRQLRMAQDKLGEERTKLTGELDAKVKAKDEARSTIALELQTAKVKRIEERDAALKAKFPTWDKEFPEIQTYAAKHLGIPAADVAATIDVRLLEGLRYAKLGFDAEQRAAKEKAAKTRVAPTQQGAAPVRRIAPTGAAPRTNPERMSTDKWMQHRNAELAKRRGR